MQSSKRRRTPARKRSERDQRKLVIFDLDGTILDSLNVWRSAYDAEAKRLRIKPPYASDKAFGQWITFDPDKNCERLGIPEKEWKAAQARMQQQYAKSTPKAFPRIKEALHGLSEEYTTAIVTNSEEPLVKAKLKALGIQVSALVGPLRHHRKPDPAQLLKCLKMTHTSPIDAVYIGDMEYDIIAAHRAGMHAIGFSHAGAFHSRERIASAHPELIVTSPKQLVAAVRRVL